MMTLQDGTLFRQDAYGNGKGLESRTRSAEQTLAAREIHASGLTRSRFWRVFFSPTQPNSVGKTLQQTPEDFFQVFEKYW